MAEFADESSRDFCFCFSASGARLCFLQERSGARQFVDRGVILVNGGFSLLVCKAQFRARCGKCCGVLDGDVLEVVLRCCQLRAQFFEVFLALLAGRALLVDFPQGTFFVSKRACLGGFGALPCVLELDVEFDLELCTLMRRVVKLTACLLQTGVRSRVCLPLGG
ncbi:hypothetical protein X946_2406 [Burkholderia sp. ABCPW 111]|nr:hypothetical protein X946_2406 [Burkholderia sp. ABCPW 111]